MTTRTGRVGALLALCAGCGFHSSGQQQALPEITTSDAPAVFSSRVNLVSVPVVVRDRAGHPVGNLKQDDFELSDKGKLQVISRFSIEKAGAAVVETSAAAGSTEKTQASAMPGTTVLPDRYIAYLVDDVHLERGDLLNTRQAMHRHLDESLDASSRAAIFTTSGQMLSDFTQDREQL